MVQCLRLQESTDLLRFCIEQGEVVWGKHFKEELSKEGISLTDAWWVLRRGRIFDAPEPDIKTGEWKYRIEGHEPGGKWLAIVFSFKTVERAFLITVFSIEARGKRTK
jgi:hypothetical protein